MAVNSFCVSLLSGLILFCHIHLTAQRPPVNTTLRGTYTFASMTGANICGYAANNREYALFGNSTGLGIVEVTNPDNPQFIVQIPALTSSWREVKVYRHYAYVTTEATGQGLQVVDLTNLPNTNLTHQSITSSGDATNIARIHALHIDTAKGYLYAFGGQTIVNIAGTPTSVDGAVVFDIKTDPWNPTYVGYCRLLTNSNENSRYIHDGFVVNDTLYGGHIYAGLVSIIDFRNKANPILVSTKQTPTAFTHNVWRSDDGKYIFTTDENGGSYLAAYDTTLGSTLRLLDKIRTPADANAIVHNTHYHNGYLVSSWYAEGVTIVDAHRPQNLVQVGQYDSWVGEGASFVGCWGVYPYLPSGNLILSNYTDAKLYVVTPQYKRACYLEGQVTDMNSGLPLQDVLVKINSTDMDKKAVSNLSGNYYTGQVTADVFSVTFSKTGYITKTMTGVLLSTGNITTLNVTLEPMPVPLELIDFQAISKEKQVALSWQTKDEKQMTQFTIERSADGQVWDSIGVVAAQNKPSTYAFWDNHPLSTVNYYRLKMSDRAGQINFSKILSVVLPIETKTLKLYPNPVKQKLFLQNAAEALPLSQTARVQIFDSFGKLVLNTNYAQMQEGLDLSNLLRGCYWLLISDGQAVWRSRFVKME
jgi:choice-of-anchor B domain-containing protein